jgi:inorganic pyrophosphatase
LLLVSFDSKLSDSRIKTINMTPNPAFWHEIARLTQTNPIIIDRPKGSAHPRYLEYIYPLDYGYLENTTAGDGDGIDVWLGSLNTKMLTGILCTFDTLKRDMEIKILLGCTSRDLQLIQIFYGEMYALYIPNPEGNS